MTHAQLWLAAGSAFAGALYPRQIPVWLGVLLVLAAAAARRPYLSALALAVLCSALSHNAWKGLDVPTGNDISGQALIVVDPERQGKQTIAVVKLDGSRYLASAYGANGARLQRSSAGERLQLSGVSRPYQGYRQASDHVAARLAVKTVGEAHSANPLFAVANQIRSTLGQGASVMSTDRQALFTGLVYGDDRNQPALVAADFRTAGLTHLLAVSGQNVAYVLMLAAPLLHRLDQKGRWAFSLLILLVFATVTRFEPSVLRATVMAALAVTGRMRGHETPSGRMLAGSVLVLLLVDPLLASTAAFQLSVAASAGIVGLQPKVARRLRGPRWVVEPLAVTVAAQLAVAPILVASFGPVSLVSIPANMAAGPLAGFVMAWGMTGGVVAGIGPVWLASAIHAPTTAAIWSLEVVARSATMVPLAPVGLRWLALALAVGACTSASRAPLRWAHRRAIYAFRASAIGVLVVALLPLPARGTFTVGRSSQVWSDGETAVLVVNVANSEPWLLEDLRNARIRSLDLVVAAPEAAASVRQLATRIRVGAVVERSEGNQIVHVAGREFLIEDSQIAPTTTGS